MSDTKERLGEATTKYQSQDFEGAASILTEIVGEEQKNWEAWRLLGFALLAQKNYEKSAEAFHTALHINEMDADNHFGYGLAKQAAGEHGPAIVGFEEALHRNPHHPAAKQAMAPSLTQRGEELFNAGNLMGAEQYYERAHKILQTEETKDRLLDYYAKAGQEGKAALIQAEWDMRHAPATPAAPVEEPAPSMGADPGYAEPATEVMARAANAPSAHSVPDVDRPAPATIQQTAQGNMIPCPACQKPMAIHANLCPHCGNDIRRPVNSDFTAMKGKAEHKTWQEITYKVLCGVWILFGVIQIVAGLLIQKAAEEAAKEDPILGGPVAAVGGGAAAINYVFGGIQVVVGIGLLLEVEIFMWIGYVMCLMNIFGYGRDLLVTMALGNWVAVAFNLIGLGMTFLFVYLLKFFGDV